MVILGNIGGRADLLPGLLSEEKEDVIVLGGVGGRQAYEDILDGLRPGHKILVSPRDYLDYRYVRQCLGDHDYLPDHTFAVRGGAPDRSTCEDCSDECELSHRQLQTLVTALDTPPTMIVSSEAPRDVAALFHGRYNHSRTGHALQAMYEKAPPKYWVFSDGKSQQTTTRHLGSTLFIYLGVRKRFEIPDLVRTFGTSAANVLPDPGVN